MAITLIQTVTVGSGGIASMDFNSIPQTYTDLMIVISGRTTRSDAPFQDCLIRFNGSTSGYSGNSIYGAGSGGGSADSFTSGTYGKVGNSSTNNATSNTFGNHSVIIPNYAGATNKTYFADAVAENNATLSLQQFQAQLWANTSAITSITLFPESSNTWTQYSSATLYGVTKGSSGGVTVS